MFITKFNEIARGPVGAAAGGLMAAGTLGNLFGDSGDAAQPQMSGYAAAPQWLKDKYERYGTAAENYFNSDASKNTNPVADLNPYQLSALKSFGGGIDSLQKELPQYMNPYNSFVTDQIRRNYGIEQNNLMGRNAMGNSSALNNSSIGIQLAQNEEAKQRALAEANYNNYNQALGLRTQTLGQMMNAGDVQYGQDQKKLSSNAQAPLQRLSNYGALLGQIPGTNSTIGPIAATPSFSDKLFGAGTSFMGFGNQFGGGSTFGNMFGGGRPMGNASFGGPGYSGNNAYPFQAGNVQYR